MRKYSPPLAREREILLVGTGRHRHRLQPLLSSPMPLGALTGPSVKWYDNLHLTLTALEIQEEVFHI